MKPLIRRILVVSLFCFLSSIVFAQEKTQYYYSTHESEILPDAREAFSHGDYERTVLLCRWHFVMVGDDAADSLRKRAEDCAQLLDNLTSLSKAENLDEARKIAENLLAINPSDPTAKKILEEFEKQILVENESPFVDTLVTAEPVLEESTDNIQMQESVRITKPEPVFEPVPSKPVASVPLQKADISRPLIVLKAGVSVLDMKQFAQTIAPGVSVGVYDLGGSRIGGEMGFYLCPGLSAESASLFGVDADIAFRAATGLYPKAGIGIFSCKSTEEVGAVTNGLCAGAGLTFVSSKHFCLEIYVKYYPEVMLRGTEKASTAGASYDFPSSRKVMAGGIAPKISIGWAF